MYLDKTDIVSVSQLIVPIRCDMRFASYPLDRQECHFKIGSVFAEDGEEQYRGKWTVLDQAGPSYVYSLTHIQTQRCLSASY